MELGSIAALAGKGTATLFDGEPPTAVGNWYSESTGNFFGHGVAVLSCASGVQLVVLESSWAVWVFDPFAPDGMPSDHGAFVLERDAPDGILPGIRIDAFDVLGSSDDDVVVECGTVQGSEAGIGSVCVTEGPVTANGNLSESDLILSGDSLGSALVGEDVDGDGELDLIVGADGANDIAGAVHVFAGPRSEGVIDESAASASWSGENPGDWFGMWATTGDHDGDGLAEVVGAAMG